MINTLHMILPGLFYNRAFQENEPLKNLPTLEKLLIKSTIIPDKPAYLESVIKSHFSGLKSGEIPAGALGALSSGLTEKGDKKVWLRADPISVHMDATNLYCQGNQHISLDPQELKKLEDAFNAHYEAEGLTFWMPHTRAWYVSMDELPDISTNALADVEGKALQGMLPSGPDQAFWHAKLNESQLLLKNHPVNTQRAQKGKPTIDSVWFWGLGRLPSNISTYFNYVCVNSGPIQALCSLAKTPYVGISEGYSSFIKNLTTEEGAVALFDTRFKRLNNFDAIEKREDLLAHYEAHWFKPIEEALHTGNLKHIYIDGCDGRRHFITKRHLRYFWRRQHAYMTL